MRLFGRTLGPATARRMTGRPGNVRAPAVYRVAPPPPRADAADADPLRRAADVAVVEAALVLADEPLTAKQIAAAAGVAEPAARALVARLAALYELDQTAFHVVEVAGGYQLLTRPAYHPWLVRARRGGGDLRLPAALLETLAVVAYKQPVTRADVEAVRGAAAAEALRQLVERGLVRPAGRQNTLGRPQVYATTRGFLQAFGLASLADLPPAAGPASAPVAGPPPAPAGVLAGAV